MLFRDTYASALVEQGRADAEAAWKAGWVV